jgi:hypothetical protein
MSVLTVICWPALFSMTCSAAIKAGGMPMWLSVGKMCRGSEKIWKRFPSRILNPATLARPQLGTDRRLRTDRNNRSAQCAKS